MRLAGRTTSNLRGCGNRLRGRSDLYQPPGKHVEKTTLQKFFTDKLLEVPYYQRDYAWHLDNVNELWNDINEVVSSSDSHYIGTFILARHQQGPVYDLVDGQQRLTTLTMFPNALIDRLPDHDRQIVAKARYLEDNGKTRLRLLGDNDQFFRELLSGRHPQPRTRGQKRLEAAYRRICELGAELALNTGAVEQWINIIGRLHVLEFIEESSGNAIRIFETVNDRGRPLSIIDKVKSFLIYTSNRYLAGALDNTLQDRFGRIFIAFDEIKELAETAGVELITPERFSEDNILRYHFLAYDSGSFYDFRRHTSTTRIRKRYSCTVASMR